MSDFKDNIKKVKSKRIYKVTNSFGVYDAYKQIRKNKWEGVERPVTQKEFYAIIRGINKLIAELLLLGIEVKLPYNMGSFQLRKSIPKTKIVNGKLKTNLPVNWDKTLDLWESDLESYNKKTLVRMETKERFKIYYNKSKADYNNKSFYKFTPVRLLKLNITEAVRNNSLDAFLMNK